MSDRIGIILEDNTAHADILASYLRRERFETIILNNILDTVEQCHELLDISQSRRQTFIFIDQQLLLNGRPGIEGSTLGLLLSEEMKAGLIHPAYLIAVSANMTSRRVHLANEAGCICQWEKPVSRKHISQLHPYYNVKPIIEARPNTAVHELAQAALDTVK